MDGGGRIKVTFYDLCQDKWVGYPATLSLSSGFDSSLVSLSKSSIISFQKDNVEEFSSLSDNEKNEKNIHHSNNRQQTISKYLKDEKSERLSKWQ